MHQIFRCISLLLFCQGLLVSQGYAASDEPQEADHIVAVVGNEVVTSFDLRTRPASALKQLQRQGTPLPAQDVLERQMLERVIMDQVQLQYARESGLRIDDIQLAQAIGRITASNKLNPQEFRQALENDGITYAAFREEIRSEMTMARLRERGVDSKLVISDGELDNHLANQAATGDSEEYQLAHILLRSPESASPEQLQKLRLRGEQALKRARAGENFAELAAAFSDAPDSLKGGDMDIPIDQVALGDRLLVKPAEIVPVDCELLSSATSLDESSLTGESMPVDKIQGDALLSGSVNGPAAVDVSVTALAKDSQYQRIIELVREVSASKSPMVRLADRYALPFTAVAFVIAGIAWAVSGNPIRFAEVLVVATPCPLLLAAPVAFMAGMSRAAKSGIVMKGSKSLEQLARARTIAFDKTGTLTRGTPAVVAVVPVAPMTESNLLGLVASAERYSSHVLSQSLQDAASDRGIALQEDVDAHEVATHGIEATIGGQRVIVGKPAFVAERVSGLVRHEGASGDAAVYVGVGDAFAGVIVLRDEVIHLNKGF